MPVYTEQEIIKGCKNRNRIYQEYLYKNYYSLFLKICARYAKSMEDAEQLLNDGFLSIFTHINSYGGTGSFEGWMKKVMVNICLDYLRSSYLKKSMKMHFNAKLLEAGAAPSQNNGIEKIEFRELVGMIQSLPPMARTVFNLFVFEGYSHKEIAGLLDISEGTSHWYVHHARERLQKKMKKNNNIEIRAYENK